MIKQSIRGSCVSCDLQHVEYDGTALLEEIGAGVVVGSAVQLFRKSTHVLYLDAYFCSDGWVILLAAFLDGNHHVQPLGFRLCKSESYVSWALFLGMLQEAGITEKKVRDLAVYSDRNPGLLKALDECFPTCEHVPCVVHMERNIQSYWEKQYGELSEENEEGLLAINTFMDYLHSACLSVKKEECDKWLDKMKRLEESYCEVIESDDSEEVSHPVYDYVMTAYGIFMWKWRFEHLMERTTNPIESCMNALCKDRYGLGSVRSASFVNRYRMLVMWILERIEERKKLLESSKGVCLLNGTKKDMLFCPWVLKTVVRRGHMVEYYKQSFGVVPVSGHGMNWEVEDWNGIEGNEESDSIGKYHFRVIDRARRRVYKVSLESREDPCSCHLTYWEHTPCVHVLCVLHFRKEYWRVWEFVGGMYSYTSVKKTCRELTKKEEEVKTFLKELEQVKTTKKSVVVRPHKRGAQKAKRIPSTGEYSKKEKSDKKERKGKKGKASKSK